MPTTRTLITGGVRSGKSRIAEQLLEAAPSVTYLAPGPIPDRDADPEWADLAGWQHQFDDHLGALLDAWRAAGGPLVAVTNEVGWSVVPEHRSGRTFRDLLGVTNQRIAAASDDVLLVVAGRVLRL
jgi:adenosylcobinamide kinase/adenosylcobinamide-phosphate guanylyltransferase